jgi:hypothetical protein
VTEKYRVFPIFLSKIFLSKRFAASWGIISGLVRAVWAGGFGMFLAQSAEQFADIPGAADCDHNRHSREQSD